MTQNQKRLWMLGAIAAPVAHIASGLPWQLTLLTGLACLCLSRFLTGEKTERPVWLRGIWSLIYVGAAAEALRFMKDCWPEAGSSGWILGILLLLGAWWAEKGTWQVAQGSILLGWLLAFLLGSVLLSAIPEIQIVNLGWSQWDGNFTGVLRLAVLLLLSMQTLAGREEKRGAWKLPVLALLFSLCTQGVLSVRGVQEEKAPFYTLSRSIRFFGSFERMESLAWVGLMLGTCLCFAWLLAEASESMAGETGEGTLYRAWVTGLEAAGISLLPGLPLPRLLTSGLLIFGVVIPWIGRKIRQKEK